MRLLLASLALLLPGAALADAYSTRGDNAYLTYSISDEEGCSWGYLDLYVTESMSHASGAGAPAGSLYGYVYYYLDSWCDEEYEYEAISGTIPEDAVFWVSPSGRSATLEATVEFTSYGSDGEEPVTFSADIEVAWTATSSPYHSMYISHYSGPGYHSYYRSHGTSRDAAVSGTILDFTLEDLGAWASLSSDSSGDGGYHYSE